MDMDRNEVIKIITAWLDSAANPSSSDRTLTIRKVGVAINPVTKEIEQVQFAIEATHTVAMLTAEVKSLIVKPPPGILTGNSGTH